VVERGDVRTIIEAVFVMGASSIVRRYVLSRRQRWIEVRDRIFWNEKDAMLKVAVPLAFRATGTAAETPYSAVVRPLSEDHVEQVNQRWVAALEAESTGRHAERFVAVLNDCSYAHSLADDTLYISVLRSPAFGSANLKPGREDHNNRYWPRQDQGEHEVRYYLMFGKRFEEPVVSRAAQMVNTPLEWIVHYPGGEKGRGAPAAAGQEPFIQISPGNVQLAALKKQEEGRGLVVRLWEQSGKKTTATLRLAGAANPIRTVVPAYCLKTLVLRKRGRRLDADEVSHIERPERRADSLERRGGEE